MLPFKEKETRLSELGSKKIRIVQNDRILTVKEFVEEITPFIPEEDLNIIGNIEDMFSIDATLETAHDLIESIQELTETRYEM